VQNYIFQVSDTIEATPADFGRGVFAFDRRSHQVRRGAAGQRSGRADAGGDEQARQLRRRRIVQVGVSDLQGMLNGFSERLEANIRRCTTSTPGNRRRAAPVTRARRRYFGLARIEAKVASGRCAVPATMARSTSSTVAAKRAALTASQPTGRVSRKSSLASPYKIVSGGNRSYLHNRDIGSGCGALFVIGTENTLTAKARADAIMPI
jgi:hypothetical protein